MPSIKSISKLMGGGDIVMASITAVIICCLLIIVLVSSQEEEECSSTDNNIEKIRLGLEWFTNPDHLPLIVAQKHGIFKTFGLDVELVEPVDHWEAEEEILAGRLDVSILFGSIGMLKWLLFTDSISYRCAIIILYLSITDNRLL